MEKVCVMMSSYNGQKYIKRQITDILNQCGCEVYLLIRDDGSTDGTVDVISNLLKEHAEIDLIQGENIGWQRSFMELVKLGEGVKADFYAFADQDDEWDPDKLLCAMRQIESYEEKQPVLYTSNARLRRENDVCTTLLYKGEDERIIFSTRFMIGTSPLGCTMVWNQCLNNLLVEHLPQMAVCHDVWVHMVGRFFGEVYFDENPHMTHLIHGDNACGVESNQFKRIKKFFNIYMASEYVPSSVYVREIDRIWGIDKVKYKDKKFLKNFLNYKGKIITKLKIFKSDFTRQLHGKVKWRFMFFVLLNKA